MKKLLRPILEPCLVNAPRFLTAIVLAGVITFSAPAQQFPNPQPGEAHKVLAKEAGTWDATVKMYLQGPDAPPTEYKGVETAEMIGGGLFLKSSFKGKMGDRDFEGHGLFGWDAAKKQYTGTWVDSFTAAPSHLTGTYDEKADAATWRTKAAGPNGEAMAMRQLVTFIDGKTKKTEAFITIDAGGQDLELKIMEIMSKRRG